MLRNHQSPFSNRLSEEAKLQFFKNLQREEANEFFQSKLISKERTLNDVLDKFRKAFTKDDLKGVARYEWDQAKYNPTVEIFSDFPKRLTIIAKQSFQDDARNSFRHFCLEYYPSPSNKSSWIIIKNTRLPRKSKRCYTGDSNIIISP